jgi:hypothetical protein
MITLMILRLNCRERKEIGEEKGKREERKRKTRTPSPKKIGEEENGKRNKKGLVSSPALCT